MEFGEGATHESLEHVRPRLQRLLMPLEVRHAVHATLHVAPSANYCWSPSTTAVDASPICRLQGPNCVQDMPLLGTALPVVLCSLTKPHRPQQLQSAAAAAPEWVPAMLKVGDWHQRRMTSR